MSETTWRTRIWWTLPIVIPAAAVIGLFFVVSQTSNMAFNLGEERALCDEAVKALLHSNDLVEITRAGIIIRRLDCSIGRRLRPGQ